MVRYIKEELRHPLAPVFACLAMALPIVTLFRLAINTFMIQ